LGLSGVVQLASVTWSATYFNLHIPQMAGVSLLAGAKTRWLRRRELGESVGKSIIVTPTKSP
jgi:hypothetical protein